MGAVDPHLRLEALREDQTLRWQNGERPPVEEYFQAHPDLPDEDALVLIVGELLLRWEHGERPQIEEYQNRLPRYAEQIAFQFELNESIEGESDEIDALLAELDNLETGPRASEPLTVPGYELGPELGQGPHGIVFQAKNDSLRRTVALKFLRVHPLQNLDLTNQFLSRGRLVVKLDHAHLVRVYEAGRASSQLYIASDFCEGGSLSDRFQKQPFSPVELVKVIEELAQAAGYAHDRGLVLGSIHPGNILFAADGRAKLTDYAIGPVLVTNPYAAPNDDPSQTEPDPTWDVYSLGAVLYEGLVGRPPGGPAAMPPHRLNHQVSFELSQIVMRCLDSRSDRRYPTGEALAADLRRHRQSDPAPGRRPLATKVNLSGYALLFAAIALIIVLALIGYFVLRS